MHTRSTYLQVNEAHMVLRFFVQYVFREESSELRLNRNSGCHERYFVYTVHACKIGLKKYCIFSYEDTIWRHQVPVSNIPGLLIVDISSG